MEIVFDKKHNGLEYNVLWLTIRLFSIGGRRGRDRMVDGFTTTYAISAYPTDVVSSNLDQGEVYNIMW